METPRNRRLRVELEKMQKLQRATPDMSFSTSGQWPVFYQVTFTCPGIESVDPDGKITYRYDHFLDIQITEEFPLQPPKTFWHTPLFHPNISPPKVCLGDHWFPGWSVASMCEALREMVRYRSFNIYDPLNKEAALWADRKIAEVGGIFMGDDAELSFDIKPVPRNGR